MISNIFFMQIAFLFSVLINLAMSTNDLASKLEKIDNYKGLIAPVFTPFKDDVEQSLNLSVIPSYAEFLSNKSVGGVLVASILGEQSSLTVEERKELAEAWADAVKKTKQHLMIQIGGTTLKNVKELAAHAEGIGADSLLVLPDLDVKSDSYEDLIDYLKLISEAAPKTPLLYYQDKNLGVNIDVARFLEAVGEKVPTFAGIQHVTDVDMVKAWNVGTQYKIFIGHDVSTLIGCVIGFNSAITISSTLIPEFSFKIFENCHDMVNTYKLAVEAHDFIFKTFKQIDNYGDEVAAVKAATSMIIRIPLGSPRPPFKTLSPEELQSLAHRLIKLGLKI